MSKSEPLTSTHFLLIVHKVEHSFNFNKMINISITRSRLLKRKTYQTKRMSKIWKKWKSEYLLVTKNLHSFGILNTQKDLKVNDIVLIEAASDSKFLWNLGKLSRLLKVVMD